MTGYHGYEVGSKPAFLFVRVIPNYAVLIDKTVELLFEIRF
jgi:hypothetical protein